MVVVRAPHHSGSGSWQLPRVSPEGLVPSYSSCTHQRLWADHAGLISLYSCTQWDRGWSSRWVPGLRAMSAGAPGAQDREAICPGPALASSCCLRDDEAPRAMSVDRLPISVPHLSHRSGCSLTMPRGPQAVTPDLPRACLGPGACLKWL